MNPRTGRLVCIDSQIFIWGIKKQSNPTQSHLIPYAKSFFEFLSRNNDKILLPAPILSEILAPVPVSEHSKILVLLDKRFQVAPFDNLAALKCAELINIALTSQERIESAEEHKVPKNKMKYDCMIVAIAITRKANCIYSNDGDIKKHAANQISVLEMPMINIGTQTDLFGNPIK
jgi:predicted nucleic acid-binding protein